MERFSSRAPYDWLVLRSLERFQERFSPAQRLAILALASAESALKIAALRDIHRRPADRVRGGKPLWRMALLINTIGPLSYFRWGRVDGR
jgi:hypothetical protein